MSQTELQVLQNKIRQHKRFLERVFRFSTKILGDLGKTTAIHENPQFIENQQEVNNIKGFWILLRKPVDIQQGKRLVLIYAGEVVLSMYWTANSFSPDDCRVESFNANSNWRIALGILMSRYDTLLVEHRKEIARHREREAEVLHAREEAQKLEDSKREAARLGLKL